MNRSVRLLIRPVSLSVEVCPIRSNMSGSLLSATAEAAGLLMSVIIKRLIPSRPFRIVLLPPF